MDISTEVAAIQAASQGSELRQPLVGALNKLNSGSLPAVTSSDIGKILKVGANGWEVGEKSGYMPVPTATKQITENGTYDVTNYANAIVSVSDGGGATNILSGADNPSALIGANGDVYLKYIQSVLPIGYVQSEYVEVSNRAYINTGYVYKVNSKIEIEFVLLSYPSKYPHVFVAWSGASNRSWYFCPQHSGLSNKISYIFNSSEVYSGKNPLSLGEKYKLIADRSGASWYLNDALIDSISVSGNDQNGTAALKILGGGDNDSYANMRMYSCKIYEGDTLVHNYIPCINLNDIAGVYDLIDSEFLTNTGSGSITNGALNDGSITDAYLKVDGEWQDLIGSDIDDVNTGS